jgi:hypothetical protein
VKEFLDQKGEEENYLLVGALGGTPKQYQIPGFGKDEYLNLQVGVGRYHH